MSEEQLRREQDPKKPSEDGGAYTQEVKHSQVSARVPEKVARGVFSTGAMILQGPHEFVLDFVLRMNQPHQIVARVILPFSLIPSFLAALNENLQNFQKRFGTPPSLPVPPPGTPTPSIEEIYDGLKLPDEQLSGCYANAVLISHTPSEFCLDFITNFYPRSSVSARVYLSVPQVPRFFETLNRSYQQYLQKVHSPRPPMEPPPGTGSIVA
jgi:hypothetical protein